MAVEPKDFVLSSGLYSQILTLVPAGGAAGVMGSSKLFSFGDVEFPGPPV